MQIGNLLGKGRTADVFEWGNGKVLKLYSESIDPDWIQHEAAICRAVYEAGVSAPRVFDMVSLDGRYGVEYERVEGRSMLKMIEEKPWRVGFYARQMARVHADIHRTQTAKLPPQGERLRRTIEEAAQLGDQAKREIILYLEKLPAGITVCHGDFHPDNVFVSSKGAVTIDWTNAYCGNPRSDVARTFLILGSPYIPPGTSTFVTGLFKIAKKVMRTVYVREYLKLSGVSFAEIDAWILPLAAGRLAENVPGEEKWLRELIRAGMYKIKKSAKSS